MTSSAAHISTSPDHSTSQDHSTPPELLTSPQQIPASPKRISPFRRLDAFELTSLVRRVADHPDFWRDRLEFSAQRRWWTRLIADPAVDVWLLSWLTEQGTELHDHGSSSAAFTVVRGRLSEVRPRRTGEMSATTVETSHVRWVPPGAVHDVSNP